MTSNEAGLQAVGTAHKLIRTHSHWHSINLPNSAAHPSAPVHHITYVSWYLRRPHLEGQLVGLYDGADDLVVARADVQPGAVVRASHLLVTAQVNCRCEACSQER